MKYPTLQEMNASREWLDVFKGYNHNLRIGEGEFYEMTNLSSDNYPILSPRPNRGIYKSKINETIPLEPRGLVAKDALCYVDGSKFVINEYEIDMGLYTKCDSCPIQRKCDNYKAGSNLCKKTLISMGAYVIIMPDKKYINTIDHTDKGDIEAEKRITGSVKFEPCTADGNPYTNTVYAEPTITDAMKNGDEEIPIWIDKSSTPHSYKVYSVSSGMWSTIPTIYIKISAKDIGLPFSLYDGVTISGVEGIDDLASPTYTVIWAKDDREVKDAQTGEMRKESEWIVVKGLIDQAINTSASESKPITIERRMPDMDFIVESGNRLWGCKYGPQGDQIVNEIYASKLGDFKNWSCSMGISTDSYVAPLGTDGQFTGAITHLGYPIFFKENYMHKVYGNYPANFQVQTTACRGVQKGCGKSLAIVNEVLYYKSRSGICAYDGSLPQEISSALGDMTYSNAVAGHLGNKYYVSMCDVEGVYHLFVYDTLKGMWHREDKTEVMDFCNCRGDLYFIENGDEYGQVQIKTVKGTGIPDGKVIKWEAVTGTIGTDSPDKKYISRLDVRMKLAPGARVNFYAEYDSSGEWKHLFAMSGVNLQTFAVPIRPQRCDHLRLKIVGEGDAKIYSICKTIEWGSDV